MKLFIVTLSVSIMLIVGGFLVPPMGVIDGSVLTAVGELFGFATLGMIPSILNSKKDVTITKGDTTIKVEDDDDDQSIGGQCE